MAGDRHRRRVLAWHLVKFCPPECTGGQAVAVADYKLECGHTMRHKHFGVLAYRVNKGRSVVPLGGWPCQACARKACECRW